MVESWQTVFNAVSEQSYYKRLQSKVQKLYKNPSIVVYPKQEYLYEAFQLTPFDQIKVVILGQDPYHNPGQAHGLAFSVLKDSNTSIPPSLKNICKVLQEDYPDAQLPEHGDLTHWAKQGVFLLNSVLTVLKNQPNSHKKLGWETFTDYIIQKVSEKHTHLVFMLWGKQACSKRHWIDVQKHLILESAHPSPLSAYRGFFGNAHFKQCNAYLQKHGKGVIEFAT